MGNMSYCRFHNTLLALQDCEDHINDKADDSGWEEDTLSPEEARARDRLVVVCQRIVDNFEGD